MKELSVEIQFKDQVNQRNISLTLDHVTRMVIGDKTIEFHSLIPNSLGKLDQEVMSIKKAKVKRIRFSQTEEDRINDRLNYWS